MRMRSKEVQTALQRVQDFAVRLWADRSIARNPAVNGLCNLTVTSGLSLWLLKVLSKQLIPDFPHVPEGTRLITESILMHHKADATLRESAAVNLSAAKMETDRSKRPWENKYLLSPEDRKMKKDFEMELDRRRKLALEMIRNADLKDSAAYELYKRGRALLPSLKLTHFICNNYRQKVEAARHKAVLLERMTIAEVKESLNGLSDRPAEVLSSESMTVVQNMLATRKHVEGYAPLIEDVKKEIKDECTRLRTSTNDSYLTSLRGTHRRSKAIPNPINVSSLRAKSLRTDRHTPIGDPLMSSRGSSSDNEAPRILRSSQRVIRIPPLVKEPISDEIVDEQ